MTKLVIIITNTAVCTGYPTAIEPKMRASTPRPTVSHTRIELTESHGDELQKLGVKTIG
ncbi:MAG TPA: hypothetical protein VEH06_11870 [Candidatus Bathyarchaeia archaeon]|nr:hypothetical protein [Candidatus Bathyarchaeia archaeon]